MNNYYCRGGGEGEVEHDIIHTFLLAGVGGAPKVIRPGWGEGKTENRPYKEMSIVRPQKKNSGPVERRCLIKTSERL